jgi:methylglutaconyl-CoA hydratase
VNRVTVVITDGVGRITLARPEKRNALDRVMATELHQALHQCGNDATVRAILLTAQGEDFCAGADIEALEQLIDAGGDAHREDAEALGLVFRAMRDIRKPVVAAVRGRALAGGAGLATACDIVLADEQAQFGYPEVRIGFVPAMVMAMLRRSVGEKHAADLVLTGRLISAREAYLIGLVSRVLPSATFDAEVEKVVQALGKSPATALEQTKHLFYLMDALDFSGAISAGVKTNVEVRATEDFRAGVRRFLDRQRRTP